MKTTTIIALLKQLADCLQNNDVPKACETIRTLYPLLMRRVYASVRGQAPPARLRRLLALEIEIGGEDGDFNRFASHPMTDLVVRGGVLDLLAGSSDQAASLFAAVDPVRMQMWLDEMAASHNYPPVREIHFVQNWLYLLADASGIMLPEAAPPSVEPVLMDGASRENTAAPPRGRPVAGEPWQEPVTGIRFVHVPEGTFAMGDTFDEGVDDEKPVHDVDVSAFFMAATPVTQAQWMRLMPENPSACAGDDHPVEQVTLLAVRDFIERLNGHAPQGMRFDLPSEAQWEYAARGGAPLRFAGSDDPQTVAWFEANSPGHTAPVGTLAANAFGLYDMSGNVWEWCRDTYLADAYRHHRKQDPVCSRGGTDHVIRGGSWHLDAWSARCARRFRFDPELFGPALGFRVVMVGS